MPLKPLTQKDKPKDNKQLLLELIAQQYGSSNAIVMDKALKTQDKQIEEAMGQGMSADDIAQSKGIDIGQLNKLIQNQSGDMQQSDLTIQKPQGLMQNLLGQSRVTTGEQGQPTGIKQGGFFDFNVGPTNTLIKQLLGLSEIKSMPMKMQEKKSLQEQRDLEIQLKRKQLEELNKGNAPMSAQDMFQQMGIPPEQQEDYQTKISNQNIRGMVVPVPTLERKGRLPAKEANDLGTLEDTTTDLMNILDELTNKGLKFGPGLSTPRGMISDILGQMKGPEFAALKSKIGRSFQKYRKWATGVAAGYNELSLLGPNYIKPTDNNEVLVEKAIDIAKENLQNRDIMLNTFSDSGYAISKLRNRDIKNRVNTWQQPQGNEDSSILQRLNLDPNKYELVR